jgi:hypothetical protein
MTPRHEREPIPTHAVTAETYHLFGRAPVPVAERPGDSRL